MVIRFTCILTSIVAGPLALAAIDLFPFWRMAATMLFAPPVEDWHCRRGRFPEEGSVYSARHNSCVVA